MNTETKLHLKKKDSRALEEFKDKVTKKFPEARFILFGSKITGNDDIFSDIDILVSLDRKVNTEIEENIFSIGFEVGLKMDVVFGIIVEESRFLGSPLAKAMPFYQNIQTQGVSL